MSPVESDAELSREEGADSGGETIVEETIVDEIVADG